MSLQSIIINIVAYVVLILIIVVMGRLLKASNKDTMDAISQVTELKINIANISRGLSLGNKVTESGDNIKSAIKKAGSNEKAHSILLTISSDLDRLL